MSDPTSQNLTPGTTVAQYEIECVLGQGAMGVVYLALQNKLDRMVALKVLRPGLAEDKEFVARFFNEARSAASLSHPNIIQAYDAGFQEPNIYYFVMEYIRGETLHERVERDGMMKPQDALAVGRDIADALNHGWKRQSLVHGDIKPENIMTGQVGETKLADFGLAKVVEHDYIGDGIMLTPLYAAPELITGAARQAECSSDIYSFGATLYHLMAGEPPFPGTDPKTVMNRHLTEIPQPLSERNPAVSKDLSDFVCNQLLAKDPALRPQGWDQVLKSIEWFQSHRAKKVTVHLSVAGGGRAGSGGAAHAAGAAATGAGKSSNALLLMTAALLLLIGCLAPAAWYAWKRGQAAREAAALLPVFTPEQMAAQAAWAQLKQRVAQDQDPTSVVMLLEVYQRDYPQWMPADFQTTMQAWRAKTGFGAKANPAGTTTLPPKPAPKPPPKPAPKPAPAVPKPAPPAGSEAKPAPVPAPILHPQPAPAEDSAVVRADDFTAILMEADALLGVTPHNLEPIMQKCREWTARYPEASREKELIKLLAESLLPGADEFLPKLIARREMLAGTSVNTGRESLPLREISLSEISFTRRTAYGEVVETKPWGVLDRRAVLTQLGAKAFGGAATLAEKTPFLAYLVASDQPAAAAEQASVLPDSPEKKSWIVLCSRFQSLPAEASALVLWKGALALIKEGRSAQAARQLQKLRAGDSALATRHAAEIKKKIQECAEWVPDLKASELVGQAQARLTDDPQAALALLGRVLSWYGNVEFPEKKDMDRLREKAIALLAQAGIPRMPDVRTHHYLPCLDPARKPYPGVSAVISHILSGSEDTPPSFRAALPRTQPLALLELGDWNGARRLVAPAEAESEIPLQLQTAVAFGQCVVAQRAGVSGFSVQEQNRRLHAIADRAQAASAPADKPDRPGADRVRQELQFLIAKAMLDNVFLHNAWSAEAVWPSADKLAALTTEAGAGRLTMMILARDLELGHAERVAAFAEGKVAAGMADSALVTSLAEFLRGRSDRFPVPATRLSPETRECAGRLLLSAWLAGVARQGAGEAAETAERLDALAVPDGWLGAGTWFDLLLVRIGMDLQRKDYAAAADRLRAGLKDATVYAAAYYPRVRMLQAGIALLAGKNGEAEGYLALAAASSAASPAELSVILPGGKAPAGLLSPASVKEDDRLFWQSWLTFAAAIRGQDSPGAAAAAGKMAAPAPSLATKRFVQLLQSTVETAPVAKAAPPRRPSAPRSEPAGKPSTHAIHRSTFYAARSWPPPVAHHALQQLPSERSHGAHSGDCRQEAPVRSLLCRLRRAERDAAAR